MNKLTAIAAALLALTASANAAEVYKNDASSVDLYGRIYAGHVFGDSNGNSVYNGSDTYYRWGVKGSSAINSNLTAIGRFEAQQYINDSETPINDASTTTNNTLNYAVSGTNGAKSLKTRLAFAGVQHNTLGAITYGRQNAAGYAIAAWTDVALTDPYGNNGLAAGQGNFVKRASDVVKYEILSHGVQFDASYKFRNQNDTTASGVTTSNDNAAYAAAISYTLPFNLSLGTAYNVNKQGVYDDGKLWILGTKFDNKAWYAAFNYGDGKNWVANGYDHKGYEASLGYNFANGVGLMALWNKQVKTSQTSDIDTATVNYYTLGAQYKFNKYFRVISEYRINNLKNPSTPGEDYKNELSTAVQYEF